MPSRWTSRRASSAGERKRFHCSQSSTQRFRPFLKSTSAFPPPGDGTSPWRNCEHCLRTRANAFSIPRCRAPTDSRSPSTTDMKNGPPRQPAWTFATGECSMRPRGGPGPATNDHCCSARDEARIYLRLASGVIPFCREALWRDEGIPEAEIRRFDASYLLPNSLLAPVTPGN